MIFDSISLEGILKRWIKPLCSCLMNEMRSEMEYDEIWWTSLSQFVFYVHRGCFPFFFALCSLFDQRCSKLLRSNGFRFLLSSIYVSPLLCCRPFAVRYFKFRQFVFFSSSRLVVVLVLSSIQIPFEFIEFPYDLRATCMCNVILLFCSRLLRISRLCSLSIGDERCTLQLFVRRRKSWIHICCKYIGRVVVVAVFSMKERERINKTHNTKFYK